MSCFISASPDNNLYWRLSLRRYALFGAGIFHLSNIYLPLQECPDALRNRPPEDLTSAGSNTGGPPIASGALTGVLSRMRRPNRRLSDRSYHTRSCRAFFLRFTFWIRLQRGRYQANFTVRRCFLARVILRRGRILVRIRLGGNETKVVFDLRVPERPQDRTYPPTPILESRAASKCLRIPDVRRRLHRSDGSERSDKKRRCLL